jgi:hypothetical protein
MFAIASLFLRAPQCCRGFRDVVRDHAARSFDRGADSFDGGMTALGIDDLVSAVPPQLEQVKRCAIVTGLSEISAERYQPMSM